MKTNHALRITNYVTTFILFALLTSSCQTAAAQPVPDIAMTAAFGTALAQISQPTQTPAPSDTPIPAATIPRTPPALPETFQTELLKPEDMPRAYAADTCQYLQNKWKTNNAAPGTVIMPIMFHGINKGVANEPNQISAQDFKKLMNDLHDMGFEAINMQQMADFMYNNAKIPARSVLLIQDDRKFKENFNDHFRAYWEQWGWPVVNGWISGFGGADPVLPENISLSKEGWIDYQAHGYIHNTPITNSSTDEFITAEMQGSITNLQTYFNKTPIAYIWPGGGFSARAVEIGAQLGYKLGFTVNPRGPVMYNWIPQADTVNASNPLAIPETPAGNPLMTIPRYWSSSARDHIDTVRQIGEQARLYAEQNKAVELDYYNIVCAPAYGSIP
jgi:hypothetical protein